MKNLKFTIKVIFVGKSHIYHNCIVICHSNAIFPMKSTINSQSKTTFVKKFTICVVKYLKFLWGYGKGKLTYPKSLSPIYTNFNLNGREHVHLVSKLN